MADRISKRLSRADWLDAGFAVLQSQGADALKAEPMARYLKTTKGSFYWHFKDVPDFHNAILEKWKLHALDTLQRVVSSNAGTVPQLRALAQALPTMGSDKNAGEQYISVRAWARSNKRAKDAIEHVEASWFDALYNLLSEIGIENREMALIIHATGTGMAWRLDQEIEERERTMGSLVDLVLALR